MKLAQCLLMAQYVRYDIHDIFNDVRITGGDGIVLGLKNVYLDNVLYYILYLVARKRWSFQN